MPAFGSGVLEKEICIERFSSSGRARFLSLRRIVIVFFFFLPLTLTRLVTNLKRYWSNRPLARAAKALAPPSAHASWVCTLRGPRWRPPRRRFFLPRSWAIEPKFQPETSSGTRPLRLSRAGGFEASVPASFPFHPLMRGKAVPNAKLHGGRPGSDERPLFQSSGSKSVISA